MLSASARKILEKRYLWRDPQGLPVETADGMFRRVAATVAAVETKWGADEAERQEQEARFFQVMQAGLFLPNSPTLMNAGREKGQLSACFVLPVPDCLDGIFDTLKNAALIHKTGGGTGFSFSRLRPADDLVASTAGVASGPVSFMNVYDAATEAVRQGGARRGANMAILDVRHPDIERFITAKRNPACLNNFNISVAVCEEFMEAVLSDGEFPLIHPGSGRTVRVVRARQLFDLMVESAHDSAEPGIVFMDRINRDDPLIQAFDDEGLPVPGTEDIEATNPCGEQPLGPGDACNLGSINLARFVRDDGADFRWDCLGDVVVLAVRFLDNVVESNHYPHEFIARAALGNRRIGLGVMGWAEALVRLGIPYDSDEAVEKAGQVMGFIRSHAHAASRCLAGRRGVFPNWRHSTWAERKTPMRNATVTTIAPTGTISIIAGTSSGIEPLFAISFVRRVLGGVELPETDPLFEKVARERGFYSESLLRDVARQGTVQHLSCVPADIRRLWKCAHDISFEWHVRMQAAFQRHTDCAVSKTINMPAGAGVEAVRQAYLLAYRLGLKGITVYRDGCRRSQVLNIVDNDPLSRKPGHSASEDKFSERRRTAKVKRFKRSSDPVAPACPDCGTDSRFLTRVEACRLCRSCGYTKC